MKLRFPGLWLCLSSLQLLAGGIPDEVIQSIDARIDKDINQSIVLALIDADGVHYYTKGSISADGPKASNEHLYEIGSITKTFTCLILADMVEKGEVKLDDPIGKFLPEDVHEPTRNGQHITLAHLATHRSSLPRMPDNFHPADSSTPYVDYSEKDLFEFIGSYDLPRDIGSEEEYSNLAMGLLGTLLARAAGSDYPTLVRQRIFEPLGMKTARFRMDEGSDMPMAPGHSGGIRVPNWDFDALAGAGAIKASAIDMVTYISANMGLSPSKLSDAMTLAHREQPGTSMGLGWAFHRGSIWHNGGTGGYRSFAGFRGDGSLGVVVLTNCTTSINDIGLHLLDPTTPLRPVKSSVSALFGEVLKDKGLEAAVAAYKDARANHADAYEFSEDSLNTFGYTLLSRNRFDEAIAVFALNVAEYPDSANPYDSLGEAYMRKGNTELAIENYRKSLALNPGNENAVMMLAKMGVEVDAVKVDLSRDELVAYVGDYRLAPHMVLSVTLEGEQLMVQATGQPAAAIFAKSRDQFYLTAVNAQISFHRDENNGVNSLTLHQRGDHKAPRIK